MAAENVNWYARTPLSKQGPPALQELPKIDLKIIGKFILDKILVPVQAGHMETLGDLHRPIVDKVRLAL